MLAVDIDLLRLEHADLIAVLKAGSHGLIASPLRFLGRQTPAESVRRDGKLVLGRGPKTTVEFN